VFYQQQNGYLILSAPDLHITIVTDIPFTSKNNTKDLLKLARVIGRMEIKIQEKITTIKKSKIKLPTPSKIKSVISDKKNQKLTAPQVALIMGRSANTIRRMADRGELPGFKSPKGTRYFYEKDILPYLKLSTI
jgi:hypothetical protein